jgi:ribosomal protein S18 acetylase RimI-like enzyme
MSDIRHVSQRDVERLAALEFELFPKNNLSDHSIEKELASSGVFLVDSDPAVGYIFARWTPDLIDIVRLGIVRDYRRQGRGTALIRAVLVLADRPVVLTVRRENLEALSLYTREGFRIVAEVPGAWIMLRE